MSPAACVDRHAPPLTTAPPPPPPANYTGDSGLPWWALTVLLIIGFVLCALYATLAATIGFTEFNTSGNGFFQMITGACSLCPAPSRRVADGVCAQRTWSPAAPSPTCTARCTAHTR